MCSGHERVAILDLEYTSWEGARARNWSGENEYREIVEIGAVVLAGPDLAEVASMGVFVRPQKNPQLSQYLIDLTGITQSTIDRSDDLAVASEMVAAMLKSCGLLGASTVWSFGEDGEIWAENFHLVGSRSPIEPSCFLDIRRRLTSVLKLPEKGMDSAALSEHVGISDPARAHRALDDCRSVANALRYVKKQGLAWW